MDNDNRIDRRATGVQKVVARDGNGGQEQTYQFSVTKAKTWLGFLATLAGLISVVVAGVWGGVQFGIGSEVVERIKVECSEGGMIDGHIQRTAYEMGEEIQGVIQDDLDVLDSRLLEQRDRGIRVEQSVLDLTGQVDENQDEIMRMLRAAAGQGSHDPPPQ